ncbi:MAG: shikimate kinase [Gemmatimonadales bacterium]|nr:shikimate kinase [Gemmatimonadales bacterium]
MGLPGAGKSTVGPLVAAELGAPWCDLDALIAAEAGQSIPAIWAAEGEAGFRRRERAAMQAALAEGPQVIAAGAGWIAQPGNLVEAEPLALILYMSLDPADAARRVAAQGGRPLLEGRDPESALRELLAERERWYRLAGVEVAVGRAAPAAAAESIVVAARQYGGW